MIISNLKVWKTLYSLTLSPIKQYHQCLLKSMESCFVPACPVYLQIIIHNHNVFVKRIFRIVKGSSIHKLQLYSIKKFVTPNGFSYLSNLNGMYLCKSVFDAVSSKCCFKCLANESDFRPFLIRRRKYEKSLSILFFNVCWVLPI